MNDISALLSDLDRASSEVMYLYIQNGEAQDEGAEARFSAARTAVLDYVAALEAELAAARKSVMTPATLAIVLEVLREAALRIQRNEYFILSPETEYNQKQARKLEAIQKAIKELEAL